MKGTIMILVLFFLSTLTYSQEDSLWKKTKIDENLTVSLPPGINQIDTSYIQDGKKVKFKILVTQAEYAAIGVVVSNEFHANIDNKETLEKVLSEISKGATQKSKEKGLTCVVRDTMLGKIPSRKMMCKGEVNGVNMHILTYVIVVNDKSYLLQGSFISEFASGGQMELNRLLGSVQIDAATVKELQFESKAYSVGYKIGYFLGSAGMLAVVIIGIIFLVRRFKL